jgi:hypothetical protein
MSEQAPESAPDTQVNVEGDAVVNQAPDGGGVDNNEAPAEGSDSE